GRRLHALRVLLVAHAQVGRERIGADAGPLGAAPAGTLLAIGGEIDLHLGIRCDDGADVAALDDDVAVLAELALPFAHHFAHGRVAGNDGNHPVDARAADRG